ncbi:MAG: FAD-binding oxidoreductase [bacterium]
MEAPGLTAAAAGARGAASLARSLAQIVGADRVTVDPGRISAYLPTATVQAAGLAAVEPASTEEVQQVLVLAGRLGVPVFTLSDRTLDASLDLGRGGVVLDMRRMQAIVKLDQRNLLVHVERGVTFRALREALDAEGLKAAAPLAAASESVLCNFVNRAPLKKATLYPQPHVFNLQVVLADGRLFRTGSHALNELEDCRDDGGPSLSRWHLASEDIFGVVTRATVCLYPKAECRDALLFGFDRPEDAVRVLRNVPRTELGWEWLAVNRRFAGHLLGERSPALPAWTVVVGFDHCRRLVEYQKGKVAEIVEKLGGRPLGAHGETFARLLDEVWYQASELHTGYYCGCDRAVELDAVVRRHVVRAGLSPEDAGQCLLSINRGRCLYAQYDLFAEPGSHPRLVAAIEKELCGLGAFFDRPRGALAADVLGRVPNLHKHLATIKAVVDPLGVLNPGRYVRHGDPVYEALPVACACAEDTGIEPGNLEAAERKLRDVVGAEWVSSNPADLAAYGRDFTIYSGERPNIVVLPTSTEEVQGVVRIAYEHKIPVVPLSTGFNHGGLTVPRKGGILVDLKRMNRLLEIDEATMTATFEPGVRMRSLWYEAHKTETFGGIQLKPILPLTLASISLLSNYVSRGGPGSMVKYGMGMDLTVNMTWVLPNGEIFRTGPSSVPGVGKLGLNWGPGPDITGMFFNADGAFGICTEITTQLYPDMPEEQIIQTAVFDEDPVGCRKACDIMYEVCQDNLVEFIYKSHPGVMCVMLAGVMGGKPQDYIPMTPRHPLFMMVTGMDEEEIRIRADLVREIFSRHEVIELDVSMLPPEFADTFSTDPWKMSLGPKNANVGAYRGAFQWQAGYIQVDRVPEINQEYKKLIRKYWKTSDSRMTEETSLTGTDIQGPMPYARMGTIEFDYWWDQGNPESVKRASVMIRKTTELMFRHGVIPIRNMFGFGELLLPRLAVYEDLLKKVRAAFDPANLMHPDVLPATDDYV